MTGNTIARAYRPGPSDERDLREEVVRTARTLFSIYGYRQTTMRMLAETLGVSVAALYYHYRSKEDIRFAVIREDLADAVACLRAATAEAEHPLDALETATRLQVRRSLGLHGGPGAALARAAGARARQDSQLHALHEEYEAVFREVLARCDREGLASIPDPAITARAILQMTDGISDWFHLGGTLTVDEVETRYVDLVRAMVGAHG